MNRKAYENQEKYNEIGQQYQEFIINAIKEKYGDSIEFNDEKGAFICDETFAKANGFDTIKVDNAIPGDYSYAIFGMNISLDLRIYIPRTPESGLLSIYPGTASYYIDIGDFVLLAHLKTKKGLEDTISEINERASARGCKSSITPNEYINYSKDKFSIDKSYYGSTHPICKKQEKFLRSFDKFINETIKNYVELMKVEKAKDGRTLIIDLE